MDMCKIDVEDIKDNFRKLSVELNTSTDTKVKPLTKRRMTNAKTLLNQIFTYGYEKKYCDDNTAKQIINISKLAFVLPNQEKTTEEETFTVEEALPDTRKIAQ